MISIIVPTYNNAHYIMRTLDSLTQQTLQAFEVIIIDDGSTDNTKDIVAPFLKTHQKWQYIYQENTGLSGARNNGMKRATGTYIYFLDSDDWIETTYLEKMYHNALENDADIVLSTIIMTDGTEEKERSASVLPISDSNVRNYYEAMHFHPIMQNKLIKRATIDAISLQFPDGLYYEDVYFFTTLFMHATTVTICSEANFYYFQHAQSIMKKATLKLCDIEKVMTRLMQENKGLQDTAWFEYMVVRHLYLASTLRAINGHSFAIFRAVTKSHYTYIQRFFPEWQHNPLFMERKLYESRGQYYYIWLTKKLGYRYTKYLAKCVMLLGAFK